MCHLILVLLHVVQIDVVHDSLERTQQVLEDGLYEALESSVRVPLEVVEVLEVQQANLAGVGEQKSRHLRNASVGERRI